MPSLNNCKAPFGGFLGPVEQKEIVEKKFDVGYPVLYSELTDQRIQQGFPKS